MAVIYKDRWQVELFFKAVQQNLRLKTFVGTSSNAVCRQVWTALIAHTAAALFAVAGQVRLVVVEPGGAGLMGTAVGQAAKEKPYRRAFAKS